MMNELDLNMVQLIVLSLACFRMTHLIVSDVITAPLRWIFVEEVEEPDREGRMSKYVYPRMPHWKALIGTLISCPWCMGFWVGVLLVAGWYWIPTITFWVALVFAISGLGSLAETIVRYWTVQTYSPTDKQLARFEQIKTDFMGASEPKKAKKPTQSA